MRLFISCNKKPQGRTRGSNQGKHAAATGWRGYKTWISNAPLGRFGGGLLHVFYRCYAVCALVSTKVFQCQQLDVGCQQIVKVVCQRLATTS